MKVADFVIIGGGSAGCVLAARLSEDPSNQVILIESGGEAKGFMVQLPVGFAKLLLNSRYDWKYWQERDPSLSDRRFIWSAGKLLGGSSSINGQVYIRGTRADFDYWRDSGVIGWGFEDVAPYFIKSEDWDGAPGPVRGRNGPLSVTTIRHPHPLCRVFIDGCAEMKVAELSDYNNGDMEGAFLAQTNQRGGWRCSTEKAYLRPIRDRANLTVLTHTHAEKLIFNNGLAKGVRISRNGATSDVMARREVVLAAGTLATPALLMRSGLGPAEHLRSHGIDVVRDMPQVGANLHEHPCTSQSHFVNQPTLNSQLGAWDNMRNMARFLWNRSGPMGSPAVQAMAFVRTCEGLTEPDAQLHFLPLAYDVHPDTVSSADADMPKEPCVSVNISLTRPKSRGRVELDEKGGPIAKHQLLSEPEDVASLVSGLKWVDRLFCTKAFQSVALGGRVPASTPSTDREWEDYARSQCIVAYHPVGSCRMGADDNAVVDPECRVRGIGGLRIADASIMPRVTSGNTNAATIMIGEKAADMIARTA